MSAIKEFYHDQILQNSREKQPTEKEPYSKAELSRMNAFQLWEIASFLHIPNYEHLNPNELVEEIQAAQSRNS